VVTVLKGREYRFSAAGAGSGEAVFFDAWMWRGTVLLPETPVEVIRIV